MAIGKLKKHKSSGIDQIQAELFIACCRTVCFEITKRLNYIRKYEEMLEEWEEPIIVPIP